ncbi:3572_t:CDS:1, partial [Gigaspora rosea]
VQQKGYKSKDEVDTKIAKKAKEYENYIDPDKLQDKAGKRGIVIQEKYDQVVVKKNNRPDTTIKNYKALLNNQKPIDYE